MPLVSKYELIKQIGKGGFSEIWLAEDVGSRERVALKVVDLTNPDLEAAEVANLVAESKFLRSLDCPFLLRCQETDASEEWLVLVLEYMAGGEIMDHIHKVKKYTEADAAKLFAQMVSAISYLHNLNLIHRDIKPENVLFVRPVEECEAEGKPLRIKVIDLGMAALYDPQKPIRGCIGTPGFVSPELWHEEPHAPACDIYALGVVLFIMLTGRKPHSGADIRLMTYCNKSILEAPGLRDERFLSLSSAARELLLAMMADDPRVRPTCMEVLRHPFITAVDSNAEAHREIEESVRRRMRELAQLRRIHGLRFALQLQKPRGADHMEFLQALEQRRLKLNGESGAFGRTSEAFGRLSCANGGGGGGGGGCNSNTDVAAADGNDVGRAGSVPAFGRCSLAVSYSIPAPILMTRDHATDMSAAAAAAAAAATQHAAATETAAAVSITHVSNAMTPAVASTLGLGGGRIVHSGRHHTPQLLQPIAEPSPASEPSPVLPLMAAGTAAPADRAAAAVQGTPLVNRSSGRNSPKAQSREEGEPVSAAAATRHRTGSGGRGPIAASAVTEPGSIASGTSRNPVQIDTMAVVNALTALQRSASANTVTFEALATSVPLGAGGSGGGDDRPPDGGSPVATAELMEQARMIRCMSANSETLELLSHQRSLKKMLEQVTLPAIPHP
ncbi:hypothetical protein Vafri_6844 [Volvox africanus]|nr:hypothetical protein Vafri_6844 [Volvox africanus]